MRVEKPVSIMSLHYPPEETGNAPYSGGLARGLALRGYRVVANVGHPHYPEWKIRKGYGQWNQTEVLDGVLVHRRRHYVPRPPRGIRRLLSEVSFGLRIAAARHGQSGVVVAVSPALFSAALIAVRLRLSRHRQPLIVWVQDLYTLGISETGQGSHTVLSLVRHVESWLLRSADAVVVVHPKFAEFASESLAVDPAKLVTIRNWTHTGPAPDLTKQSARLKLGLPTDVHLVIHTGNMGTKQGLSNVIEAAKIADRAQSGIVFVLVGDGAERDDLERSARGVASVRFMAPVKSDDYPVVLAAADVLLVNEKEGVSAMSVPSKLTSYFNAGRPILAATDPAGITASELKSSGAGAIVRAGDPAALLEAVDKLLRDESASERFGAAGRRYKSTILSEETALNDWEDLLARIAAG